MKKFTVFRNHQTVSHLEAALAAYPSSEAAAAAQQLIDCAVHVLASVLYFMH